MPVGSHHDATEAPSSISCLISVCLLVLIHHLINIITIKQQEENI